MVCNLLATTSAATVSDTGLNVELLLSVIAVIISIATAVGEFVWNKTINVTNLESEFYKEIYFDYLMKIIPQARQYIHYSDETLSDIDKMTDALNSLRQDSLFFKYKDKEFYKKIKEETQSLEEYLIEKEGKMDADAFSEFNTELTRRLEGIYSCIMERYKGNKIK